MRTQRQIKEDCCSLKGSKVRMVLWMVTAVSNLSVAPKIVSLTLLEGVWRGFPGNLTSVWALRQLDS